MAKFSANLGFLWADLPLPAAIRAAQAAGFDAVECHFPYDVDPADVRAALSETGLTMLCLNTAPGDLAAGEFGLAALPHRRAAARTAIDQAIAYACAIETPNIHVMAGKAEGGDAEACFIANLQYGAEQAAKHGLTLLIEPINTHDVPGYFLTRTAQAAEILAKVAAPNVKMMFDCYHVARMGGDVRDELAAQFVQIGHVQFAGVPARGRPDNSSPDYRPIFEDLAKRGYQRPLGAEYRPEGSTEASLGWMQDFRRSS